MIAVAPFWPAAPAARADTAHADTAHPLQLEGIQQKAKDGGHKILTPLVSLDTPGKATVQVVILADPVGGRRTARRQKRAPAECVWCTRLT